MLADRLHLTTEVSLVPPIYEDITGCSLNENAVHALLKLFGYARDGERKARPFLSTCS